ncbi:hypothetical protein E3N88_15185 [Mikania micrantha]|uniref:CCHC-type domain-containing protein n=1 Tax=Mikania micrantha TaxID=192012 RepID=A0A5N6NXW0_9ASTR|nr:hypothetical protein E3N88_15185 [Mikania micrantha]
MVTFPETPTPSTTHSNPFSNSAPLLTSGQGDFMAEETNYFHLCQEDLDGIPADDLEEMDINYQMAMISYRAKKFYQRTGRQFKQHNMKTGFGLDKSKLKCVNCQQLGHFSRECKSSSTQPSTSGQPHQRSSSSSNSANVAEQDFADWSFQAEDASISNSALMANDSTSSFKVTDDMCTLECLEKLNVYKRINSQLCNELESLQVVKANFFESERNYKENIEEMEKTISSLKHEDTNKQCQINNLLERDTGKPPNQLTCWNIQTINLCEPKLSRLQKGKATTISQQSDTLSLNYQTVCLMRGETNHFAADCFYNPRSRFFSKTQGRGRKKSWSKSSVSSEEQGRKLVKKVSEASTSDNHKKQGKKSSEGKKASEAHAKSASDKLKKSQSFGRRRRTSEKKTQLSTKTKPSEGKAKGASDGCQKKQAHPTTSKVKQIWKKKETTEPTVQPPISPAANSSSVPPRMMSKKFVYNDANGKPKTTWAWVPIRN